MFSTVYSLILVTVATNAFRRDAHKPVLRIYNGVDDDTQKYPYVVALKPEIDPKYYVHRLCTGTLIHPKWVLSAAHCLMKTVKYVQYGNLSQPLDYADTKSRVIKMIKHPRVFPASYTNNLGLLLVVPIAMAKYGSLLAVDYLALMGAQVEYAGFGMSYYPKRNIRDKIKQSKLDIQRPLQIGEAIVKSCSEPFSRNFICLSSKCSKSQLIMAGDSGAPLVCEDKIIGVACTFILDHNEQIFTPISPHISWIQKVVASDNLIHE